MMYVVEPVTLEVVLYNPMKVQLVLMDLCLLWKFLPTVYNTENTDRPCQLINNESTTNSVKVSSHINKYTQV